LPPEEVTKYGLTITSGLILKPQAAISRRLAGRETIHPTLPPG